MQFHPDKQTISDINMKDFVFFGSPIAHYEVSMSIVDDLNQIADSILAKGTIPPRIDYSTKLASAVDKEFSIPMNLIPDIKEKLEEYSLDYHRRFNCATDSQTSRVKMTLQACWIVSQIAGDWNYLHSHAGDISGVLYLKIPKCMHQGIDQSSKKALMPGGITFTEGRGGRYQRSSFSVVPKISSLYLFPSSLLHTVYPFFGDEERRSFSFNVDVKSF